MNYQLTETEFNAVESCLKQMDLMTDLCSLVEGRHSISIDGLQSFLCAQQEVLHATLEAATERLHAQLASNKDGGVMQHFDWIYALRIASGDSRHIPSGVEQSIAEKLARASQIDPDMQGVLDEWVDALARASALERQTAEAAVPAKPPAKRRKREGLVAA